MSILNLFESREVKDLRRRVASMQNEIDVLVSGVETKKKYTGNPYSSCDSAIESLALKYEGLADWGNQQVRNVIDVRSAFIIGEGITISEEKNPEKPEDKSREIEFIEDLIKANDLDEEVAQAWVKEAEIEGRFLARLIPDPENETVQVRWVSYTTNKYEVETDPNDYKKYLRVKWKDANNNEIVLEENEFVYKRFAGRTNKVNRVIPKTGMVLRQIEDLDKCLWDWRKINHLFAAPTPYFKTEDSTQADALYQKLKAVNWKLGKFFVGTADFDIKSAPMQGIDSLKDEITNLAKIISGAVGVPVHFLGLPDLMTNRSTSSDLFEFISASTNAERRTWIGFYEEMIEKSLLMANTFLQKGFKEENTLTVDIPFISQEKIKALVETWLPLFEAGAIDLTYFVKLIPNADEAMMKRLEEKEQEQLDRMIEAEAQSNQGDDDEE